MFSLDFPFAYGRPILTAEFRSLPEDFAVFEDLGFEPEGEGEHIYLHIRKLGQNTRWVAQQLAEYASVKIRDVGYCGLKDRHSISEQWFSIYDPQRKEIDWQAFVVDGIQIQQLQRHTRKLKPGLHQGNKFDITLRNFSSEEGEVCGAELAGTLNSRLIQIARAVPNYFGEQRFGHDSNNLKVAQNCFDPTNDTTLDKIRNRKQRGMIISAARSWMFNQVLIARVEENSWELEDDASRTTSGPLWGRGRSLVQGSDLEFENQALEPWLDWCEGLEHVGLKQERRPLALRPKDFQYSFIEDGLQLSFYLLPGQYATGVLRELCCLNNMQKPQSLSAAVV